MTEELLWAYAFNLIVNSFLAFLTTALFIQLLLFIFRVKLPRFKALLLCIPLVKLVFDPFLYDFQNWALMYHINPLEAEVGSRMLSAQVCAPEKMTECVPFATAVWLSLNSGQTFTPGDIAALSIAPVAVQESVIIVGTISCVLFSIYIFQLLKSAKALYCLIQNASPCRRALKNRLLIDKIQQTNSQLITSSHITVPCAFGIFRKRICLPSQLIDKLSQGEFEAIVAHELAHLLWYDGFVRLLCHSASTVFWWVPTRWWLNRLEHAQEIACDAKICKFHIAKLDLASAIIKTAKTARKSAPLMLFTYFVQDRSLLTRLRPLLAQSVRRNNKFKWLQMAVVGFIAASILFGRFWIF